MMIDLIFQIFSSIDLFGYKKETPMLDKVKRDMKRPPHEVDAEAIQSDFEAVLGPKKNWGRGRENKKN